MIIHHKKNRFLDLFEFLQKLKTIVLYAKAYSGTHDRITRQWDEWNRINAHLINHYHSTRRYPSTFDRKIKIRSRMIRILSTSASLKRRFRRVSSQSFLETMSSSHKELTIWRDRACFRSINFYIAIDARIRKV